MTADERLAWLESRRSALGASEFANLVGLGYGNAMQVYLRKVEPVRDEDVHRDEGFLACGNDLEPIIGQKYARKMGVEIVPGERVVHPEFPWLAASPDFSLAGDPHKVQCKTIVGFDDEWGPSGSDKVPTDYRLQVNQEMACTGTDWIDLAALDRIAWQLRVYRVTFSVELWDWQVGVARDFWHNHVLPQKPPGPEWDAQFAAIPHVAVGTKLDLGGEIAAVLDRRAKVGQVFDEAEKEYDRLTDLVKRAVGDAEHAVAGPWKIKQTLIKEAPVAATVRKAYPKLTITRTKGK